MKNYISLTAIVLLISINIATAQKSQYKIANKFSVEGDGGWDYLTVDDTTGHLYISHQTVVQVIDTKDGKLLGTIKDLKGVHGIALAQNLGKGFITNGRDSSVTVFDLTNLSTIGKIPNVGQNPDAIMYDNFTKRVFTFNGGSNNITAIDAITGETIGKIALDGNPEFAVTNGKGKIFCNVEDLSMICQINPKTLKVENKWRLKEGKEPSGLAIDVANNRLFTVCDNKLMMIVDCETGKIITSVPIGEHPDGCGFDPVLKRAYSSNGDGTLTVVQEVDANTFKVLENVETQKGARTITVSAKTHHIYLPTAERGEKPKPTAENPKPRPAVKPNSFVILDVELVK
jgi:DNA-binding beta-propeller fold protein YncE